MTTGIVSSGRAACSLNRRSAFGEQFSELLGTAGRLARGRDRGDALIGMNFGQDRGLVGRDQAQPQTRRAPIAIDEKPGQFRRPVRKQIGERFMEAAIAPPRLARLS